VFYFRKHLELDSSPETFVVHISADNRYKLFVNGDQVTWGPALDDLYHWNYRTIDLAPFLYKGENILAAQVWNPGRTAGSRQISSRTGFILQGGSEISRAANSDDSWVMLKDDGYHFKPVTSQEAGGGYIAGATDSIVGEFHPWNWYERSVDDSQWEIPVEIGRGNHAGLNTWLGTPWLLKERPIPDMEQRLERIPGLVRVTGMDYDRSAYNGQLELTVPPLSRVELILDNKVLTMGFPRIHYSGGKGCSVRIQYQEALFDRTEKKGNRNDPNGKHMKGYYDVILPDGGEREFEPLWIRVFRFVKLTVETGADPLHISDFFNHYTAYPFELNARFESDDPSLEPIWEASWRTARLCALETYMDCPYYEQIQYIGDTRIQALISLYVSGDDRLVRNALNQFYNSMQPMGLTQSRFPADGRQIIPPFSLYYIAMVHDYHMHRDDPGYIKKFLPGIRFILEWFAARIDESGMLGPIPFWNHIDGGTGFRAGSPPGTDTGGSAHMTILLAYAIDRAVELFEDLGDNGDVDRLRELSASLKNRTRELCLDHDKGLLAETPSKEVFSQHTNIFAILTGLFQGEVARTVAERILSDKDLIEPTLYFRFYLFQALKMAGMGSEILNQMEIWTQFLDQGLTTFPEHGLESRSDCHGWAAHPMYDLLAMVCGIVPGEPGFRSVIIEPSLGNRKRVASSMPHPRGMIEVDYLVNSEGIRTAEITLPDALHGTFIWKNKSYSLVPGRQVINMAGADQ
jgi:hypothetical protein